MNERIKELWEDATVSTWPRPGKFTAGEYDYHLEKFAELIAKECAAIAMTFHGSTGFDSYDELEPYEKGVDDAASIISSTIRRNFGV